MRSIEPGKGDTGMPRMNNPRGNAIWWMLAAVVVVVVVVVVVLFWQGVI